MPETENTGYLVQLQSPEGDKVYPIISALLALPKNWNNATSIRQYNYNWRIKSV